MSAGTDATSCSHNMSPTHNKLPDCSSEDDSKKPLVIVVIGMAGSGKTTFVTQLHNHLSTQNKSRVYSINLDPAVLNVPFACNINICDTIKYKQVMKEYRLGPNGAIMTCLNLFATRFDRVLDILEKRAPDIDYIIVDTPGQIEVFNWSASGTIILESLASMFPTCIVYIIDTCRCERPVTFMSNMLYACSVLYKTKLPLIACFNKIDVVSHLECLTWMTDYEKFADALSHDNTYMATFSRSCSLALVEFYECVSAVGVSAVTGDGYQDLVQAFKKEYVTWKNEKKKKVEENIITQDEEWNNVSTKMANIKLGGDTD